MSSKYRLYYETNDVHTSSKTHEDFNFIQHDLSLVLHFNLNHFTNWVAWTLSFERNQVACRPVNPHKSA